MEYPEEVLQRARRVRFLLLDVDGILTEGRIIVDSEGREIKSFFVQDGLGIKLLQRMGFEVGILSSRTSLPVAFRARELGIETVIQGELEKGRLYQELLREKGLRDEEVAYMGDDWVDIPVLKRVGFAITVPEAWPPVKEYVHYITRHPGGRGAVREVCDLLLKAQGKWEEVWRVFGG
ncbi:MAG TPA: HAD family hydrolase [Thermosulfurimonas dismutans]|uniref:HAD family hydrolase n=1 Tax=Thermosulfurimonas dismutans TaxID=999894 RepID=A0A7C3CZ25_9BACT|nr:HAD family hydrolase [Thermosulfurimonas dismutans]